MKKTNLKTIKAPCRFLFALCLGLILQVSSNPVVAQGNLQFNRVLLLGTAVETVPPLKVWKVEAAVIKPITQCMTIATGCTLWSSFTYAGLYINGIMYGNYSAPATSFTSNLCSTGAANATPVPCLPHGPAITVFPVWLPAGATVAATSANSVVSIIEFNIVP